MHEMPRARSAHRWDLTPAGLTEISTEPSTPGSPVRAESHSCQMEPDDSVFHSQRLALIAQRYRESVSVGLGQPVDDI